jgi:hypothetical protein
VLEYLPSTLKTLSPIPSTGKKERKANGRRKKWREGGREGGEERDRKGGACKVTRGIFWHLMEGSRRLNG